VRRPLSNLLFGSTPAEKRAAVPPPTQAPAARPKLNDMFAMVQAMSKEEMKKSGVFGAMRRTLEASAVDDTPTGKTGFYASAEKATSFEVAIMRLVSLACAAQPTLLVLDDLHNATEDSLSILRKALKEMTRGQLVVLMTYEPMSVALDVKTEIVPDLGEDETMRVALANLHATDLGPRLSRLLWERTSGRPLYIESLIRTLQDRQFIEINNGVAELVPAADVEALPDDVRQLVVSRVDRLSPEAQGLVRVAAVLGGEFTPEALSVVGEYGDDDHVMRLLEELIQSQIVEPVTDGTYEFRHGMTGSVIYGTLSRAQRARLHRAAADFYRVRAGESAGLTVAAAYHLAKCGLLPQAIDLLVRAADDAERDNRQTFAHDVIQYAASLMPDDNSLRTRLEALKGATAGA
jgi:predicted ATPase